MRSLLLATLVAVACTSCGADEVARPSWSSDDGWLLTFSDDFDQPELDRRWEPGWFGSGVTLPVNQYEDSCFDESNVWVSEGVLNLRVRNEDVTCPDGKTRKWSGALVSTRTSFEQVGGGFEARIRVPFEDPQTCLNFGAFWLNGHHGTWPDHGEIDIFECLTGRTQGHAIWNDKDGRQQKVGTDRQVTTEWHTFGVFWIPGQSIEWFYDGISIAKKTGYSVQQPKFIILDHAVSAALGGASTPETMSVDWVRAWQRTG